MYSINVEKRVKMLSSRYLDPDMKQALLDYYGNFEEMALCGVSSFGRAGYTVPMKQGAAQCFGGPFYWRPGEPEYGASADDLRGLIRIDMLSRKHCYVAK